ncbi:MAG: hypothetical protein FWD31_13515, partial [Planctomycetaceae bacterium]|nr:hypothetical protein [Planctomycetaceae bacterium]
MKTDLFHTFRQDSPFIVSVSFQKTILFDSAAPRLAVYFTRAVPETAESAKTGKIRHDAFFALWTSFRIAFGKSPLATVKRFRMSGWIDVRLPFDNNILNIMFEERPSARFYEVLDPFENWSGVGTPTSNNALPLVATWLP